MNNDSIKPLHSHCQKYTKTQTISNFNQNFQSDNLFILEVTQSDRNCQLLTLNSIKR